TSLSLWLALHEPELCGLSAEGEWTQRNLVPCLVEIEGRWPFCVTSGLLDENGLSVLMRASHSDRQDGSAFELWVRSFGVGEALVQRLKDHLVAWDAAGRPTTDKLHIRAYPAEAEYTPNPGESVIRKHWTHFVLDWR
ncbi:MAG: hypothetical protein ACRDH2_02820, partial [Anaerolineales bacterium]